MSGCTKGSCLVEGTTTLPRKIPHPSLMLLDDFRGIANNYNNINCKQNDVCPSVRQKLKILVTNEPIGFYPNFFPQNFFAYVLRIRHLFAKIGDPCAIFSAGQLIENVMIPIDFLITSWGKKAPRGQGRSRQYNIL